MNKLLSLGLELRSPGESQDEAFPGENTALLGASLPQCMFALGSNSRALSAMWGEQGFSTSALMAFGLDSSLLWRWSCAL